MPSPESSRWLIRTSATVPRSRHTYPVARDGVFGDRVPSCALFISLALLNNYYLLTVSCLASASGTELELESTMSGVKRLRGPNNEASKNKKYARISKHVQLASSGYEGRHVAGVLLLTHP